jgi:hypothetical protein
MQKYSPCGRLILNKEETPPHPHTAKQLQQTLIPLLKSIKNRKLVALDICFFEFGTSAKWPKTAFARHGEGQARSLGYALFFWKTLLSDLPRCRLVVALLLAMASDDMLSLHNF